MDRQTASAKRTVFLYSPHAPIVPTEALIGESQAGGFGDFMTQTDAQVGRILKALDENGFGDNTLVIFTADNGAEHYAYERIRNFQHRSSGPLRGVKRDLYEGGHRVPFIVKWPGAVKPGSVSDALVSQVDLFATLAAIVGHALPTGVAEDSHNMSDVWKQNATSPRRSIVHNTMAGAYAVRHDHWLLIANKTGAHSKVPAWFDEENGYPKNDQPGELYDLRSDLAQKHNLYATEASKVKMTRTTIVDFCSAKVASSLSSGSLSGLSTFAERKMTLLTALAFVFACLHSVGGGFARVRLGIRIKKKSETEEFGQRNDTLCVTLI